MSGVVVCFIFHRSSNVTFAIFIRHNCISAVISLTVRWRIVGLISKIQWLISINAGSYFIWERTTGIVSIGQCRAWILLMWYRDCIVQTSICWWCSLVVKELGLLRKLYLRVILGCIFFVPCVSVWHNSDEGAYIVVFVIGLSPEAPTVFILDLDKPFVIFFHFSNVVVRSPERSASVLFSLVVRVNSEIFSKKLSKHALCSSRVSYVS